MKSKHFVRDLILCAILGAAAAGATMVYLPLLPVAAAVVLLYGAGSLNGVYGAVLAVAGYSAVMYPLLGSLAIPEIAFAAVVSFGAVLVVKYAKRAFFALCGACGVALLAMWANVLVGALLEGPQVIETLFVADEATVAAMQNSYVLLGYTEREVAALVGEFTAAYGEMVPGILLVFAMLSGVIAYGASTYLAKPFLKFKAPAFEQWYMPNGHLLGAIVLLLLGYLMEYLGWEVGAPVLLAVELFIIVTYSIQGMAVVWFILSRTRMAAPLRYLAFVAGIVLLFGFGLLMLAVLDNVMLLRKRMPPRRF